MDQQRNAADGVVNDLVEIEDVDGIGEYLAAGLISEHRIVIIQPGQRVRAPKGREVYRDEDVPEVRLKFVRYLAEGNKAGPRRSKCVDQYVLKGHTVDAPVNVRNDLRHDRGAFRDYRCRRWFFSWRLELGIRGFRYRRWTGPTTGNGQDQKTGREGSPSIVHQQLQQ